MFRTRVTFTLSLFCLLAADMVAQNYPLDAFKFRNVGPIRGGRVTTIEGVNSKPATFYMGATGGWCMENR